MSAETNTSWDKENIFSQIIEHLTGKPNPKFGLYIKIGDNAFKKIVYEDEEEMAEELLES